MVVTAPDWLTQRGGTLKLGPDGNTWFALIDNEPQYRLVPIPAAGKYSCHVVQTINGKRLDKGSFYPTVDDAIRGGLEDLRQALGW
jgi:hypothetical protein